MPPEATHRRDAAFQRPAASRTYTMAPRHLVVRARAGVVAVPPVWASGVQSLTIQPAASTVTVPISVIAGPPPDTGYEDPIVEVIVEAMVMGEVVVVVVMPIPMPVVSIPSTATIPGDVTTTIPRNVTPTTPPATTPVSTSDTASLPTPADN